MSNDPIKKQKRGPKTVLVIDFFYLDKTGRRCRYRRDASFQDDPKAARDEARRLQNMAVRNGTLATRPPAPTFSKFFSDTYRTVVYPRLRPATRVRYDALVRQTVGAFFGTTSLSSIEGGLMRRFEGMLAKRGVTARGPVNLVRSVLRSAFELGFIDEMPALPPAPRAGRKLARAPTRAEIETTAHSAQGWVRIALLLAAFGGLRSGEVRALQAGDVDLIAGVIRIRRAFSESTLVDEPKDGDERLVPIAPAIREVLKQVVAGKAGGEFLVTTRRGRVPGRQHVWTALRAAQVRAGIEPPYSFHQLRHAFCSELARRGASVEVVRVLAGHADLRTTQRYLHADNAELVAAIGKLA